MNDSTNLRIKNECERRLRVPTQLYSIFLSSATSYFMLYKISFSLCKGHRFVNDMTCESQNGMIKRALRGISLEGM